MCEIYACGGLSIAGRFPYKSETGRNTSDSVVRLIEGLENVFAICSKTLLNVYSHFVHFGCMFQCWKHAKHFTVLVSNVKN